MGFWIMTLLWLWVVYVLPPPIRVGGIRLDRHVVFWCDCFLILKELKINTKESGSGICNAEFCVVSC